MSAKYCAISAKLKAMQSLYLTEDDYNALLSKNTIPEICAYLKNNTGYRDVLANVDDRNIRRLALENHLSDELKKEYIRMYMFVGEKERRLLYIWFMRSEVEFLKRAVHCIYNGEDNDIELLPNTVSEFFKTHSKIDVEAVGRMKDFDGLIKACENTVYHDCLKRSQRINADAFAINMRLDSFYYQYAWRIKERYLKGREKTAFEDYIGREIDALNMLWIYRGGKYFDVDRDMLYTYIIPIRYKLKEEQIKSMVESTSDEEFLAAAGKTVYGEIFASLDKGMFPEQNYTKLMHTLTKHIYKCYSGTIVEVFAYFRMKENEINNIKTIIEGVRYEFSADAIRENIVY